MKLSTRQLQFIIIGCSLLLFSFLFLANKKPPVKAGEQAQKKNNQPVEDIKTIVMAQLAELPPGIKKTFSDLGKNLADTNGINKIVDFFLDQKMPVPACYYFEKKAQMINSAWVWYLAGNRYFYSTQFTKENVAIVASLFQGAAKCYTTSLEKDPAFMDAKIQLASCFVEGSDPMKGITMLKELEKTDSTNLQVQLVLGRFAMRSGQTDKAEARYLKILRLKPDYLEAYLFLADVYQKMGEKAKTIEVLEKYVSLSPDKDTREQVKTYIEQIKHTHV